MDLVQADLKFKHSGGFGSLDIHARMTQAQLEELEDRDSELLKNEEFVTARLLQLQPGPDVDWREQSGREGSVPRPALGLRRAPVPAFNPLKAHVLYHRLDLDRSRGVYDRKRFLRYLELPREVSYANPK